MKIIFLIFEQNDLYYQFNHYRAAFFEICHNFSQKFVWFLFVVINDKNIFAVFQMLMGRSFISWSEHLLRAVSLGVEDVEFLAPQVQRMGDPPPLSPPLSQELHMTVMPTTT